MKKENRTIYKIIAILALILAVWSCKDDINKAGYDLLLPGDLVSAHKVTMDKSTMSSYTVVDENLSTNKPNYNLLGTFVDPVFGISVADFAAQFKLLEVPKYKSTDEIDSTVLIIRYRSSFYGDTVAPLKINVYELTADLNDRDDAMYYQNVDLKGMTNGQVVGSILHKPQRLRISRDTVLKTVDTTYTNLRIKLNKALEEKLVNLSLSVLGIDTPNVPFLKDFKGLYVESEPLTEAGAILRAAPDAIAIYTHKWKKTPEDTIQGNDSIKEVIESRIDVTKNSARVSRFDHGGYQTAKFYTKLGENPAEQDTLIYLQTTGGLSSKIYIPDLDQWADSTGVTINKAELIFTVERTMTDTIPKVKPKPKYIAPIYTVPPKLILSLIGNDKEIFVQKGTNKGQLIYPADLTFSESYYGGWFDQEAGTYTFNLAAHLQKLMKKEVDKDGNRLLKNNGFYLTTDNKNSIFSRVVLKGAKSTTGIRFEVTYTKIK